jgi:hypothetical protein
MTEIGPGVRLRRRALESEAIYTVIAVDGDLIEVEVVRAPGLPAGKRLKFTCRDVRAMEPINASPPSEATTEYRSEAASSRWLRPRHRA